MVRREAAGVMSNHALDQLELDPDTGETVSCRWGKRTHFCMRRTGRVNITIAQLNVYYPQWKSCAIADEGRQDSASVFDCEAAS